MRRPLGNISSGFLGGGGRLRRGGPGCVFGVHGAGGMHVRGGPGDEAAPTKL